MQQWWYQFCNIHSAGVVVGTGNTGRNFPEIRDRKLLSRHRSDASSVRRQRHLHHVYEGQSNVCTQPGVTVVQQANDVM